MKKTNFFYAAAIALVSAFGMTSCSVEDNPASDPTQPQPAEPTIVQVSLQDVPFWAHPKEGGIWGVNAPKENQVTPSWEVGVASGLPYGDGSVLAFADLAEYDKLIITYHDGTPRVLLNRDVDEGSYKADEAESHLIEYPACANDWAGKYFTDVDGVLTVDLKQILADKGFVALHSIKGANWSSVIVESMILEKVEE